MKADASFAHLHVHSVFTFTAGVATVEQLVERAKALGMKALALTDTDRMSGLIRFYLACRKAGIRPILGVELTEPGREQERVVVLARNERGYGDICEITTRRQLEGPAFSLRTAFAEPLPDLFLLTDSPDLLSCLAATPNRRNLYGELIGTCARSRSISRRLIDRARHLGLPLVLGNDVHFLAPEDWETHRILRAIALNTTLSRLKPGEYASREAFLKTPAALAGAFPTVRDALENTGKIAAACRVSLTLNRWILPEIPVPEGFTPGSYLKKLALEGLQVNYGHSDVFGRAKEIQHMELEVISKLGYPSYFLMVKQIRDWANRTLHAGYRRPRDCSILRGSAANSITFYNLGVSDLDPIRCDLYFQRFLNEERASPPDADLDFGWDERERVLDHMVETWGRDRVALVCTTHHFRRRAAFRETAKVYGHTEEEITRILKSWRTLSRRIADDEIRFLLRTAEKIRGKPRFLGQHPGGVLVTNDPIYRHVACEFSGGPKNRVITQIDMHNGLDELGLIKFDILGNGSLSVLRDTLAQIRDQGLADPGVWDLERCFGDEQVARIIAKGRTKGIFYIESPAQSRLNRKAGARTFEEITLTSSLVRPAGSSYIKIFVERHRKLKDGIRDWDFLHPSLQPILEESHDVCAFQEDITKICIQVAGLGYKQADKIRKMMNSLHEGRLTSQEYRQTAREFIAGCRRHRGLSSEQALELWERVSSFTGFSFCKSHSASYAQLSFKCAYLKAHYPAQFLSSVISNNHGFYTTDVYLDEARRWGLRILPVDINQSVRHYRGKHNWIRPGLMHVRGLSSDSIERIADQRTRNGRFLNLMDFMRRVKIRRTEIESLIRVGAFDRFGLSRPELLYLLDGEFGHTPTATPPLFPEDDAGASGSFHPGLIDYSFMEKCLQELHCLGYMLSANIVDILDLHPASRGAVPAADIGRHRGKRIKVFGRRITERTHMVQKSRRLMKFMTIEDKTECIDIVFWPGTYDTFSDEIAKTGPFEIWGRVAEEWDTFTLEADTIRAVRWFPGQVDFRLASRRLEESLRKVYTYEDITPALAG